MLKHIDKLGVIYRMLNPIGQIYIGQTIDFNKRMFYYKTLKCKGQKLLYKSLFHYGFDNHKIDIIRICNIEDLDRSEIEMIKFFSSYFYNNRKYGLNLTLGGESKRGYITSPETKAKISASNKGKTRGRNRIFSDETIRRMCEAKKNVKNIHLYKPIVCYKNGEMKKFNNITEAANILNLDKSSIVKVLKGKYKTTKGYYFRYN